MSGDEAIIRRRINRMILHSPKILLTCRNNDDVMSIGVSIESMAEAMGVNLPSIGSTKRIDFCNTSNFSTGSDVSLKICAELTDCSSSLIKISATRHVENMT